MNLVEKYLTEAKPRGGDYFEYSDGKIAKIGTTSPGFIYIDTGKIERDVAPMSDLEQKGKHKGKKLWYDKSGWF